jgi:streptogramin lyase
MPATLWRSPIFKSVGLKTTATLGGVGLHHELRPGEKKRDRDDQQLCAGEMIARLRCQRLPLIALLGAAVCVAKPVGAETNIEYGSFNRPLSITTGPDGALWFTENGGNKIARITTAGVITEFPIPTADSNPTGITAGPDGALWFAEASADKIGRITTEGVITEFPITAGSFPTDITTGPDGALWFPEYHAGQIGRITTMGVLTEFGGTTGSPQYITTGPDGALWFTECLLQLSECAISKIGRITTGGVITEISLPSPTSCGASTGCPRTDRGG